MATKVQAARLLVRWAATRADAGHRVDTEAGWQAVASEAAQECALLSMHVGYGYSREFVVERLYRDAPLMSIGEGTNDIQRLVIARRLLSERSRDRLSRRRPTGRCTAGAAAGTRQWPIWTRAIPTSGYWS